MILEDVGDRIKQDGFVEVIMDYNKVDQREHTEWQRRYYELPHSSGCFIN